MKSLVLALCAVLALAAPSAAQAPQSSLPEWWVAHVAFVSGGTWISLNPPGDSDATQPDAFAMEWRAVNEGHGLVGRLSGLRGGAEVAEYWTFREFWHPGERRAIVEQWGGPGVYGVGQSRWEDGQGVLEQTFWLPDGRSWREGHRNREMGDTYETNAYDIDAEGRWTLNDTRVWRRATAER